MSGRGQGRLRLPETPTLQSALSLPRNRQAKSSGGRDPIVPPSQAERYAAHRSDGDVRLIGIPCAGHFELVDPNHDSWTEIHAAVRGALGIEDRPVPPRNEPEPSVHPD